MPRTGTSTIHACHFLLAFSASRGSRRITSFQRNSRASVPVRLQWTITGAPSFGPSSPIFRETTIFRSPYVVRGTRHEYAQGPLHPYRNEPDAIFRLL
ncbi:hypothetical protein LLG96_00070 [bacterium]|nr:hypothetical protein [bacterium]